MRPRYGIILACFTALLISFDAQAQDAVIPLGTPLSVATVPASVGVSATVPDYVPPKVGDRLKWVLDSTLGPLTLAGGAMNAGWGTASDKPSEYGTHWTGFAERYGLWMSGIATSNVMEASFGAIWGEDPRYLRTGRGPLTNRVGHAVKMTFLAKNREGNYMPAYARYTAIVGSNFLSNTWRPDSDATANRATVRIGLEFVERLARNMWDEFWPDVKDRLFRR